MDYLTNLDSETLKAELLAFLELGDDEFDISSMGEFEEQLRAMHSRTCVSSMEYGYNSKYGRNQL